MVPGGVGSAAVAAASFNAQKVEAVRDHGREGGASFLANLSYVFHSVTEYLHMRLMHIFKNVLIFKIDIRFIIGVI